MGRKAKIENEMLVQLCVSNVLVTFKVPSYYKDNFPIRSTNDSYCAGNKGLPLVDCSI